MPPSIEFCFDFISPYAYLAWPRVKELAEQRGLALYPRPVLFAGLLQHGGQLGPAEVAEKRLFTIKDVVRRAHDAGLPLTWPPSHPFRPLTALRASLPDVAGERQAQIIDALFDATWARGANVGTDEGVAGALDAAGLEGAELVARTRAQDVKDALRRNTDEAIERGVFGVPTILIGDEPVWGHDRMADVERILDGDDPAASPEVAETLKRPPSGLQRKRRG